MKKESKKKVFFKEYGMVLGRAFFAGIMISIGGSVNLMMDNKIVGAILFSIGLFLICTNGFNLYTGKIGYVINNKVNYLIELFFTLIGNIIGTVTCGYLLRLTRVSSTVISKANTLSLAKLNDSIISILILSIGCGILMYLAVDLFKKLNDFGKYMALFLGVSVFILCGFEHCVANMFYFSVANIWTLKTILYVFIMVLGNSIGSIMISLGNKYFIKRD